METISSYISCRSFNGICIPLPIQTAYLRSYAEAKGMTLSMPNVEWTNSIFYSKFISLINDNNQYQIAICSIFMLDFIAIEKEMDKNTNSKLLHFPLENKILKLEEAFTYYKKYIEIRALGKDSWDFI